MGRDHGLGPCFVLRRIFFGICAWKNGHAQGHIWAFSAPSLNYVGLRPPCVILGWAPEGAQPQITLNVGLRPPFAPAARFPVGPYLAPARNLPLGELIDTSFGAVRGPIRPFLKIGPTRVGRAKPLGIEPGFGRRGRAGGFFRMKNRHGKNVDSNHAGFVRQKSVGIREIL